MGAATVSWAQTPPPPLPPTKPGGPPSLPPRPGEPQELTSLRQQYLRKTYENSRLLNDQFTNALSNVERELAANGDYEQAMAVQRRRQEITDASKSVLGDNPASNAIVLHPADAKIAGTVYYDKGSDTLNGWRKAAAAASWDLPKLTPGAYQLTVNYFGG